MIPAWSPEAWNSLGAAGLAVFFSVFFVVALQKEWIVIGKTHRDIVARLDRRAEKDAEVISKLSAEMTEKNATADATRTILASLREALTASGDVR